MPDEKPTTAPATPAPAPRPDRLNAVNNTVTVLVGIFTVVIGVWVKLSEVQIKKNEAQLKVNEVQLREIDTRTKEIETREKTEAASYKFANAFLTQIKDQFGGNPHGTQLAVAALNIIAQASSGDDGKSSADARSLLPLHMALLLGDSGSLVTLDERQEHVGRWCEFASVDANDLTRVTAIKALCGLSRQSIRGHRLEQVDLCTIYIEHLYNLLAESDAPSAIEHRTNALIAKNRLWAFITRHDKNLSAAKLPAGDLRNAPAVAEGVLQRFDTAIADLQEVAGKLRAASAEEAEERGKLNPPATAPGELSGLQRQQKTLALVNEALQAVAFTGAASAPKEMEKLIGQLTSDNAVVHRKACSDLALLRQAAVRPMLAKLAGTFPDENAAANARLGVAMALSHMLQPITLNDDQSSQIAKLIGVSDAATRSAAVDFLMNLESAATIQNVYEALAILLEGPKLEKFKGPAVNRELVKNAARILGMWARDNKLSDGSPLNVYPAKTVENLMYDLQGADPAEWSETISTIKDLLQRAQTTTRKAPAY